jgi:hypothetical protein
MEKRVGKSVPTINKMYGLVCQSWFLLTAMRELPIDARRLVEVY